MSNFNGRGRTCQCHDGYTLHAIDIVTTPDCNRVFLSCTTGRIKFRLIERKVNNYSRCIAGVLQRRYFIVTVKATLWKGPSARLQQSFCNFQLNADTIKTQRLNVVNAVDAEVTCVSTRRSRCSFFRRSPSIEQVVTKNRHYSSNDGTCDFSDLFQGMR